MVKIGRYNHSRMGTTCSTDFTFGLAPFKGTAGQMKLAARSVLSIMTTNPSALTISASFKSADQNTVNTLTFTIREARIEAKLTTDGEVCKSCNSFNFDRNLR